MGEREDAVSAARAVDYEGGESADTETTARADGYDEAAGYAPDEEVDEAARLRAEIEQTRAGMGETLDEIQQRLSPANIKEQVMEQVGEAVQSAKDTVREATIGRVEKVMENVGESMGRAGTVITETGSSVVGTIRQNPLPAALIGLGVGMLLMNRNRGRADYPRTSYTGEGGGSGGASSAAYDYKASAASRYVARHQARPVNERAGEAIAGAVSGVRETAASAVSQTREQVSRLGGQVQQGARRAGDQFQTHLRENPLAVGAVALALGMAVGLAVPSTQVENQYMGEARDTLVDKAQDVARGAMDKVQQVAQDAGRSLEG